MECYVFFIIFVDENIEDLYEWFYIDIMSLFLSNDMLMYIFFVDF